MSTPAARASVANRRTSPASAVARTSTSQPPARSVSRMPMTARAAWRAAAGFVIRTARVTSVPLLPEEIEAELAQRTPLRLRPQPPDRGAAAADGLEARLGPPLGADAELQACPQPVRDVHLSPLLAEAGVQDDERLATQLPPGGELGAGERLRRIHGAELEIVERHPQVRDEGALDLAGDAGGDEAERVAHHRRPIGRAALPGAPLGIGRTEQQVRDDLGLRELPLLRRQREFGLQQGAADVR